MKAFAGAVAALMAVANWAAAQPAPPTMVVVGDQDVRTPDAEAEQLYGALKLRGVPTILIKVPGAYHDMAARPSQSAAKANAILAWFARYDVVATKP